MEETDLSGKDRVVDNLFFEKADDDDELLGDSPSRKGLRVGSLPNLLKAKDFLSSKGYEKRLSLRHKTFFGRFCNFR